MAQLSSLLMETIRLILFMFWKHWFKLVGLQRIPLFFVIRIEVVATSQENNTSARFEKYLLMYRGVQSFSCPLIGIVAESVLIFI